MHYFIIYPKGDRNTLKVSQISTEDYCDYAIASEHMFDYYNDALAHARYLADKYNLNLIETDFLL